MNKTAVLALDLSPAAEPLLECAAELRRWGVGPLLIVCGKHGQHWVHSMVVGSIALRLCEMAGRPVLLVPLPHHG